MMVLAAAAAAFALVGLICMTGVAVYYVRARGIHAQAEELNAIAAGNLAAADASQREAGDLLARIQEHSVC